MHALALRAWDYPLVRKYFRNSDGLTIVGLVLLPLLGRTGWTGLSYEGSVTALVAAALALGYYKAAYQPFEGYRLSRPKNCIRWVVLPMFVLSGFGICLLGGWIAGSLMTPEAADHLFFILDRIWGVRL
jgi:hypothetical protein